MTKDEKRVAKTVFSKFKMVNENMHVLKGLIYFISMKLMTKERDVSGPV